MRTLQITALCLPLTSLLLLAGCNDPAPSDGDEAGDSGTDGTATETDAGTEVGTDDNGTTTTTDEAETGPTTDETTEGETTDETTEGETTDETTDETTETTDGGACEPAPNDDECTSCLKDNCCDAFTACFSDPDCACMATCLQEGNDPQVCAPQCMVNGFPPELQGLAACMMQSCQQCL
jgi:hypothetical protein